jgi:hypothetical protein
LAEFVIDVMSYVAHIDPDIQKVDSSNRDSYAYPRD